MKENIDKKIASLIDGWGLEFDFNYDIGLHKTDSDRFAIMVKLPHMGDDCWWGIEQCIDSGQMVVVSGADNVPWEVMEIANAIRIANDKGDLDFVWDYTHSVDRCGKKVLMN